MDLRVRPLAAEDPISSVTALLHRSYAGLATRGLRYLATHQDDATTARRIGTGECLLAELDGVLVGTITWHRQGSGHPWYEREGVATFQQFCCDPKHRARGIGSALLAEVEARARTAGATELACDTAAGASDLIEWYEHRGYRVVGEADWRPTTNYVSVVLSKTL